MSEPTDPIAQIAAALKYPPNGDHYCRWCGEQITGGRDHSSGCSYVEQCKAIDLARANLDALRAQRTEGCPSDLIEALEFAWGAIIDAIGLEEGLDGKAGETVLGMIEAALKAHGRPVSRPQGDGDVAWFTRYLEGRLAALKPSYQSGNKAVGSDVYNRVMERVNAAQTQAEIIERTEGRPPEVDLESIVAKLEAHIVGNCECVNGIQCDELLMRGIRNALRGRAEAKWAMGHAPDAISYSDLEKQVADLQSQIETLTAELREGWWLNHGCPVAALYSDDGERQCGACGLDFKRHQLDDLRDRVHAKRLARAAEAMQLAAGGRAEGRATWQPIRALVEKWREQANQSGLEATRIYNTVKVHSDAQERCYARQQVWKQCADDLEALLPSASGEADTPPENCTHEWQPVWRKDAKGFTCIGNYCDVCGVHNPARPAVLSREEGSK